MSQCVRCNDEVTGIGSLFTYNRTSRRCKNCEEQVRIVLQQVRQNFIVATQKQYITREQFYGLLHLPHTQRIEKREAMEFVKPQAIAFLSAVVQNFSLQKTLTDEMEQYFLDAKAFLELSDVDVVMPMRTLFILNIRRGKLITIPYHQLYDLRLEADELCYAIIPAEYCKKTAKSMNILAGKFVVTSKKLRFLSEAGGTEINWSSIMIVRVAQEPLYDKNTGKQYMKNGISLELNKKSGNGFYILDDAEFAQALIDTLVKISKRQIVATSGTRSIPQDVRTTVWQRDQGKCIQCGATEYLEYDHIIPFSKGGATSVNNLQLLCRKCNLAKSDRI